jgi:acetyl-CoA C-acetyltransferase
MSRYDHLDGRTPVVVGAAEVVHRAGEGFVPTSATELMLEATQDALASSGVAAELGPLVGEVLVPHGTWSEPDPGRALAVAIGAPDARSVRSELGVLQLSLLGRAASAVAAGGVRAALVVGAENRWSGVVSAKEGRPIPEPAHEAVAQEPDELVEPTDMIISTIEIERNLTTAAHQYAIIESALRHHLGRSVDEHQRWLGELWGAFARIAAEAPAGWDQRGLGPDDISLVSDTNRLIAAPYPKWLVSQWNVDQGAALVVTSVEFARRLGIAEDRWVFPAAVALSNLVVPLPERDEIHRWPAMGECGAALRAHASLDQEDLAGAPVDLYSCFPVAVEVQAHELGISPHRALTLTGGMTFGGGPFNNYALQGAAAMVRQLRDGGDASLGLTTAVSGLLTKPAAVLWTTEAPTSPFAVLDVTEAARAATPTRAVDPDLVGAATLAGYTVVPDRDGSLTAVAVVESSVGVRSVAQSHDRALNERLLTEDLVGLPVELPSAGEFTPG